MSNEKRFKVLIEEEYGFRQWCWEPTEECGTPVTDQEVLEMVWDDYSPRTCNDPISVLPGILTEINLELNHDYSVYTHSAHWHEQEDSDLRKIDHWEFPDQWGNDPGSPMYGIPPYEKENL